MVVVAPVSHRRECSGRAWVRVLVPLHLVQNRQYVVFFLPLHLDLAKSRHLLQWVLAPMEVNRVEVVVLMVKMTIHSNLYLELRGRVVAHSFFCLIRLHAREILIKEAVAEAQVQ